MIRPSLYLAAFAVVATVAVAVMAGRMKVPPKAVLLRGDAWQIDIYHRLPLRVEAYDRQGRRVGPNAAGGTDLEIPGVLYAATPGYTMLAGSVGSVVQVRLEAAQAGGRVEVSFSDGRYGQGESIFDYPGFDLPAGELAVIRVDREVPVIWREGPGRVRETIEPLSKPLPN